MFNHVTLTYHEEAGDGTFKDLLPELSESIHAKAKTYLNINLSDSNAEETLIQALDDTDLLIIAGGDGTVHHVINLVYQASTSPTCAILPAGTANDFARALGMPLDLKEALDVILRHEVTPVDLGICKDYVFLNFFGVGLVTQSKKQLEETDDKEKLGRFGYYLNSIRALKEPERFEYKLTYDDETLTGHAVMIMISNGGFTGGVNLFFGNTVIDDGQFDVVVIEEANLKTLHDLFTIKREVHAKELTYLKAFKTSKLTLETTPEQQIDCDGETKNRTPASITVKKHALNFCYAKES